jgi:hypothetical protein
MSHVPEEYHDLKDVFSKLESDQLPPHQPYNHHIPVIPGAQPPWTSLIQYSPYVASRIQGAEEICG